MTCPHFLAARGSVSIWLTPTFIPFLKLLHLHSFFTPIFEPEASSESFPCCVPGRDPPASMGSYFLVTT